LNIGRSVELGLIVVLALGARTMRAELPDVIELGNLLLVASVVLLGQSLLRDLWLLAVARRKAATGIPRSALCMCAESSLGIAGVLSGGTLAGAGLGRPVIMGQWTWSFLVMLVTVLGYLIKDYVLEMHPWRVRRDPDHLNVIVSWRK